MALKVPQALIDAPALTRRLYALNTSSGLPDSGLQILLFLGHVGGEMRAKAIQDALTLEQSQTSHLLKALANAGLVSWVADERYSRRRSYSLTEEGGRVVADFVRQAVPELDQLSTGADVISQGASSSGVERSRRQSGG